MFCIAFKTILAIIKGFLETFNIKKEQLCYQLGAINLV